MAGETTGIRERPEECIVFVLLIPKHVVFSYPPKHLMSPHPTVGGLRSLSRVKIHSVTCFSSLLYLQIYSESYRWVQVEKKKNKTVLLQNVA